MLIDDLLTEEEILDLAQRLKIATLILDGKKYIGQVIKYGKGGLQKILDNKRRT